MAIKKTQPQFYNNNPNLKAAGVVTEFTKFQDKQYTYFIIEILFV